MPRFDLPRSSGPSQWGQTVEWATSSPSSSHDPERAPVEVTSSGGFSRSVGERAELERPRGCLLAAARRWQVELASRRRIIASSSSQSFAYSDR